MDGPPLKAMEILGARLRQAEAVKAMKALPGQAGKQRWGEVWKRYPSRCVPMRPFTGASR